MIKNLAKVPLIGLLYAALFQFVAVFFPKSPGYAEATAEFALTPVDTLVLLGYAVVAVLIYALAFSMVSKGGIKFVLFLTLGIFGLQFACPLLWELLMGEPTGTLTTSDQLLQLARACGTTLLILVLSLLLFKSPDKAAPAPGARTPAEPKYKVGILGLIIKLLVLPAIYCIAHYLTWYFLLWRNDAVRVHHGIDTQEVALGNFMGEIIDILINRGSEVLVVLLIGLAYAAFMVPLLLQMRDKRIPYLILNTLLCLMGPAAYLIPSPMMAWEVRLPYLVQTGALLLLYSVLAGILLHLSFGKREATAPAAEAAPAKGAKKGKAKAPAQAAKPAEAAK